MPGDLLLLAAGDAVGADARLIEEAQLQVAEAALTGESVPVSKACAGAAGGDRPGRPPQHGVFGHLRHRRTGARGGRGHRHAHRGRRHRAPDRAAPRSRRRRWSCASRSSAATWWRLRWCCSSLVVALGLLRGLPLADVLMVAISQMVSMVPEGLPVAMTIALAVGMQRMAGRGAIIRRLSAVETLGSTTVICSDKTGTLTRNEMTVSALWLPGGREIAVTGVGYAPHGALTDAGAPVDAADAPVTALLQAVALCNDAELVPPQDDVGALDACSATRPKARCWSPPARPASTSAALRQAVAARGRVAVRLRHQADGHAPPLADDRLDGLHQGRTGSGAAPVRGRWPGGAARGPRGRRRHGRPGAARAGRRHCGRTTPLDAAAGFDALAGRARRCSGWSARSTRRARRSRWPSPSAARPASGRSWSPATTSSPAWPSRASSASRAMATAPSTAPSWSA